MASKNVVFMHMLGDAVTVFRQGLTLFQCCPQRVSGVEPTALQCFQLWSDTSRTHSTQ